MSDLQLEIYEDLGALALTLARRDITHNVAFGSRCEVCGFVWGLFQNPRHADSCVIGTIFKLVARLGEIRDKASIARAISNPEITERYIEYSGPVIEGIDVLLDPPATHPVRRVTHEQAASAAVEGCR